MVPSKSLEYSEVFIALLCDVQTLHSGVFTSSNLKKTINKVNKRFLAEGVGFLTKTLPRLGKALDRALAEYTPLDATKLGLKSLPGSKLPMLLGELFQEVLHHNGEVRSDANVTCVRSLRQLLFMFYKLKLPNDPKLEQSVIDSFVKTELEVTANSILHEKLHEAMRTDNGTRSRSNLSTITGISPDWVPFVIRKARLKLSRVFADFDTRNIFPRHGPGAVSTRERLEGKYQWTNISERITRHYPVDAYFYASMGHVCDSVEEIQKISSKENSARVILVPKDSRGPRLISCEPLEFQWIQQGLGRAIVSHVEHSNITRFNVHFTQQEPNQFGAELGSKDGRYATLDLKEASDRVTCGIVRLLFPEHLSDVLLSCRSLDTKLPDGRLLKLSKFAPMGSALCFPVLALVTWSLLSAGLQVFGADPSVTERILVYGDDVIVPTPWAEHAMIILESFGLKINRDKSCTKGFFRESCGVDAFAGERVTPVRFRTTWSSFRCPETYVSWVSYANSLYKRGYMSCYEYIVGHLSRIYPVLVSKDYLLKVPSLPQIPESCQKPRSRVNPAFQRLEYRVLDVVPVKTNRKTSGWRKLLRFFSEGCASYELARLSAADAASRAEVFYQPFSVSAYTERKRVKLRMCWR